MSKLTLTLPNGAGPGVCPILTDEKPCGQKATGLLINDDIVIAATCEAHGRAAEPPWRWQRASRGD